MTLLLWGEQAGREPGKAWAWTAEGGGWWAKGAGSSRIESVLKSLADLVRAQEAEIASLRRDGQRFAELRRLVAR